MSMQSRLLDSQRPAKLLSFSRSQERATIQAIAYDAIFEKLPYHPWYSLDRNYATTQIHHMCSSLLTTMSKRSADDAEIEKLCAALEEAKTVSHKKSLCIAILREQVMGKRQCLCSAFGRDLVHVSSSSSACTAFPTIVAHKIGASDDSQESDVLIQLGDTGTGSLVNIELYTYTHDQCSLLQDLYNLKSGIENDDDEESQELPLLNDVQREQIIKSARTAKRFFSVIFKADSSPERGVELMDALSSEEMRHASFIAKYVRWSRLYSTCVISSSLLQYVLLDDLAQRVQSIREPPSIEAWCLQQCSKLRRAQTENHRLINEYQDYVLQAPGAAYLKHEADNIERALREKGVQLRVLLKSARQYAMLSVEAAGISRLRQYLLGVPARMNYDNPEYHVHEMLPDIVSQILRILGKFKGDSMYEGMRRDLVAWLPRLEITLDDFADCKIPKSVIKSWGADKAEEGILRGIASIVKGFRYPSPFWTTFLKLLREKGMPVNGVAKGLNMNNEIMVIMEPFIRQWRNRINGQIGDLTTSLNAPVQFILAQLRAHIENLTRHAELKSNASAALETRARRIGLAQGKLRTGLESKLRATYVHYKTETNVYAPVALAMKPFCDTVLDICGGRGAYARHCKGLQESLCAPEYPMQKFSAVMATNIAETLKERWAQCCRDLVSEVMAQLKGFREAADGLLDSGKFVKTQHQRLRDELHELLFVFKTGPVRAQQACPWLEAPDTGVLGKRKGQDDLLCGL
ncbi:uncharacterized protein M421DRAFT_394930 [Didymella exigua CBS 183.55]|uniref:Uncharacterized protein n=1 Tax=Didymella exigua CBS 183.55 TaxID=1150837 RepID=A0A6A5RHS1_9PLEO|nr:uncharacterized protein M421DRAFT_394930 [Didymella exigua CBS 183.55]KAF1927033.1 hypothetical protein M421DRAFT_394930 [Didymella exigua CBS 183.55]